ncbi:MAG: hypothetical protein CMO80_00985 [Verrucomicrobiales bacterium]|nr:hypothetical protein [Verrucomicrobiales bacterium]
MKSSTKTHYSLTLSVLAFICFNSIAGAAEEPARIKLSLSPQANPRLGLQYELLPKLETQRSGNAALAYYNIILANRDSGLKKFLEETGKSLGKNPSKDDLTKIEKTLKGYRPTLANLARAASYRHCDWQAHLEDGFAALLPYLADLRRLSELALLQARVDLTKRRFGQAIGNMQTAMAIADHASQDRTLIGSLVGIAITRKVGVVLQTYVQTKGAPNLHWALSDLPRPMFNLRDALHWERSWHKIQVPELAEVGPENVRVPMEKISKLMREPTGSDPQAIDRSADKSAREAAVKSARTRLRGLGVTPAQLSKLSPLETVFLSEFDRYRELSHDLFKWANLPYPQNHTHIAAAGKKASEWGAEKRGKYDPFPFHTFFPALSKANERFATTERNLDAWRCIEAIRHHLANNNGKFPGSLEQIQGVAVPLNAMTGKDFRYELKGNTATLTARTPANHDAGDTTVYELSVR